MNPDTSVDVNNFESERKTLQVQKYPYTCGRGLGKDVNLLLIRHHW